ncbi:MAG TPA: adenylate/guanylate cyclase domain-containing protein, partial [Candidatus Xenobia bacterium]
ALAALEGLAGAAAVVLFNQGYVLETAPLLCAIPVAGVSVYAWRFGFVWRMFGRYVSTTLLQDTALLELGTASRRHVTVLFTDINNFSTTCERHTPDEVIGMLNRYFEAMNAIIVESGGWIKQFVGDEIMVIYGAPDSHPRPEHAAVETALRMVAKLADMRRAAKDDGFFEIKAGIHTGDVIVGNVGSRHRTEFAAVGDDVNLGSRIMGMTKGLRATILISGATEEKVQDLPGVVFVDHGLQPVKGRHEPVRVFEVKAKERE